MQTMATVINGQPCTFIIADTAASAADLVVCRGSVVLLQEIFHPIFGQSNDLALVASTLGISALFQPLQ